MSHRTRGDDGSPIPERKKKPRKKRPNLIGNSKNRDVYYHLMQAGWSSTSLSFYAEHMFGERIAASTFRSYRAKRGWPARSNPANIRDHVNERLPAGWRPDEHHDTLPDVFHERTELIRLQKLRVAIAVRNEVVAGELNPTTRLEIAALSKLIGEVQADLQLMGQLPGVGVAGDGQDVGVVREVGVESEGGGGVVPEWAGSVSFGDVVGGLDERGEAVFARSLQELGLLSSLGNGQVVDGG